MCDPREKVVTQPSPCVAQLHGAHKQAVTIRGVRAAGQIIARSAHIGNHLRAPLGVNMMGYAKNMPGSRVLDEGVDVVYFSGVVPKG